MKSEETLRERQSRFVRDVVLLIMYADRLGMELTFGETWRTSEQAKLNNYRRKQLGKNEIRSLHQDRLAIDLNLFINGEYQEATEAHKPLGEFWESLGPDHHWGGHFDDGNHYSIGYQGRK